jgi:transposase-like protein
MVTLGGQCPFCQGLEIVQNPKGPTRLTWYRCRACRRVWSHQNGSSYSRCPECNGRRKAKTLRADSVMTTLRCGSCGSEWLSRTTGVFERWLNKYGWDRRYRLDTA